MKCKIFLVVRTNSERLPKKALLKIRRKPMIQILIDRIKNENILSDIIVCTTNKKSDNELVNIVKKNKIKVFRGNEKDIIKRLHDAAKKFQISNFVVVEGDDIFCDLDLIKETCQIINRRNVDFVRWEKVPFGSSPVGINSKKLTYLVNQKLVKNTETGWIKFILDSNLFRTKILVPKNKKLYRTEIRLSVDYREDLTLAKQLLKILPDNFRLIDIINTFKKFPELSKINESVKLKYIENFEKKMIRSNYTK